MTWLSSLQLGFDCKSVTSSYQAYANHNALQSDESSSSSDSEDSTKTTTDTVNFHSYLTDNSKTRLCHRLHTGALMVQRPLYPEPDKQNGICHIYVLYPPAGIADGDFLTLDFNLNTGSHAVITTPGAGKWYGHRGRRNTNNENTVQPQSLALQPQAAGDKKPTPITSLTPSITSKNDVSLDYIDREIRQTEGAKQTVTAHLADNTILEWLPQESIYYDYSFSDGVNRFELADSASLLTWDISVFGRRAHDEHFNSGHYGNCLHVQRGDKVLISEHTSQPADSRWFNSMLGLNGQHVQGSFWAVPCLTNIPHSNHQTGHGSQTKNTHYDTHRLGQYLDETIQRIREVIDEQDLPIVCTHNFQAINCRYIGGDVRACFEAFYQVRELLRKIWYALEPHRPRIWDT